MKLSALFVVLASVAAPSEASESPFLKEILTGRCYEQPPNSDGIDGCPVAVGSIMSVLEGHKDADITTSSYDSYIQKANFASDKDTGLFWIRFLGAENDKDEFLLAGKNPPPTLMTPEDTPGGALLKDLVFCGVDQQKNNCKKEESNAYWSFWEAALGAFASQVTGKIQIVVEPSADASFLTKSVTPFLDKDAVTEIAIFAQDCTDEQITKLIKALPPIGTIECQDDIQDLVDFMLCQDPLAPECLVVDHDHEHDVDHYQEHDHEHSSHLHEHNGAPHHFFFGKLIFMCIFCGIIYYVFFKTAKSGYENLPQTNGNQSMNLNIQ